MIPSIVHYRNGEDGNNNTANTIITINVEDYTTLSIGSVALTADYSSSVTSGSKTIAGSGVSGTFDITEYPTITFKISEKMNVYAGGEVGFYNIVIK